MKLHVDLLWYIINNLIKNLVSTLLIESFVFIFNQETNNQVVDKFLILG